MLGHCDVNIVLKTMRATLVLCNKPIGGIRSWKYFSDRALPMMRAIGSWSCAASGPATRLMVIGEGRHCEPA